MRNGKKSYAGYSMTPIEWAESLGLKKHTLNKRFRSMGVEGAITYQIKKRIAKFKKEQDKKKTVEFLEKMELERQRIEDEKRHKAIDEGVESWNFTMLCRGYFRKETKIKAYKQLNNWYKEFRAEAMKAA